MPKPSPSPSVAASSPDRPDGPFTVCNWDPNDPKKTVGPFGFDPAVLVDDDGRVYGYWGFWHSFAAELDPETMATVKPGTKIVENMVSSCRGVRKVAVDVAPLASVTGKQALFFTFDTPVKGHSVCELNSLRFSAE